MLLVQHYEDEGLLDWLNLSEHMAGKILGDAYAHELDPEPYGSWSDEISERIEEALSPTVVLPLREYLNDIEADLANCALARAVGCKGSHADFFELLYRGNALADIQPEHLHVEYAVCQDASRTHADG